MAGPGRFSEINYRVNAALRADVSASAKVWHSKRCVCDRVVRLSHLHLIRENFLSTILCGATVCNSLYDRSYLVKVLRSEVTINDVFELLLISFV